MRDTSFSRWIYSPIIIIILILIMVAPAWSMSVPIQNHNMIIHTNHDDPISSAFSNLSTTHDTQSPILSDDMKHLTFDFYHPVSTDDQNVISNMNKTAPIPETSTVLILMVGLLAFNFFRKPSYRGVPIGRGINNFKGGLGSNYA